MQPKSKRREPKVDVLSVRAWRTLRQPFILPPGCCSTKPHDWEAITVDVAGCKKCGDVHVCDERNPRNCRTECVDNSLVCTITGLVLRTNNFQVDWVPCSNSTGVLQSAFDEFKKPHSNTEKEVISLEETRRLCFHLLCSQHTLESFEKEYRKVTARIKWSFNRHVREHKHKNNNRENPLNLILLISNMMWTDLRGLRFIPTSNTSKMRRELAEKAAVSIYLFIRLTSSKRSFHALYQDMKVSSFCVGILYMLRTGLVHCNTVVLPCLPKLKHLLPTENQIDRFGFRSKIITMAENSIKGFFRNITIKEFESLGFDNINAASGNRHQIS
jgi:hypothetical protein